MVLIMEYGSETKWDKLTRPGRREYLKKNLLFTLVEKMYEAVADNNLINFYFKFKAKTEEIDGVFYYTLYGELYGED